MKNRSWRLRVSNGFMRKASLLIDAATLIPGAILLADASMCFGWLGNSGGGFLSPSASKLLVGLMALAVSGHMIGIREDKRIEDGVKNSKNGDGFTTFSFRKHTPDLI